MNTNLLTPIVVKEDIVILVNVSDVFMKRDIITFTKHLPAIKTFVQRFVTCFIRKHDWL